MKKLPLISVGTRASCYAADQFHFLSARQQQGWFSLVLGDNIRHLENRKVKTASVLSDALPLSLNKSLAESAI